MVIFGDTRAFGLFDCSGTLDARGINCRGALRAFRISPDFKNVIKSYVQTMLLDNKVQPILDGSSTVNGNRVDAFGTASWVVQTLRNYTQLNSKGDILGNQPSGNVQYNGSITAGIIEANTSVIVGIGHQIQAVNQTYPLREVFL